eukprot:680545-Rhodomonas_salina.3
MTHEREGPGVCARGQRTWASRTCPVLLVVGGAFSRSGCGFKCGCVPPRRRLRLLFQESRLPAPLSALLSAQSGRSLPPPVCFALRAGFGFKGCASALAFAPQAVAVHAYLLTTSTKLLAPCPVKPHMTE